MEAKTAPQGSAGAVVQNTPVRSVASDSSVRFTYNEPPKRFNLDLGELFRERELLGFFTMRTLRVRYKQSLAGPGWAIFQPLASMIIFVLVFGRLAKLPTSDVPYPLFYYSGLVLWTLVSNTIGSGTSVLVENQALLSKVYFPRIFLPLSVGMSSLVDLGVGCVLLIPLMIWYRVISWQLPFLLLAVVIALLASVGLGMFLSALNAKYRDVRFAVPFLIQAGLFASPIAYSSTLVPAGLRWWYGVNPFAGAIELFRRAITGDGPPLTPLLVPGCAVTILLFAFGTWYFQRVDGTIADVV